MGNLMDIIIRDAKKEDADILRDIEANDGFKYPYKKTAGDYLKYMDQGTTFYIAEKDGEALGYISGIDVGSIIGDAARLRFLAVKKYNNAGEETQGQGVGTQLMWHLEQKVKEQGHSRVIVAVYQHNTRAMDFYHKRGYQHWFFIPHRYEGGIGAHVYYKDVGLKYLERLKSFAENVLTSLDEQNDIKPKE